MKKRGIGFAVLMLLLFAVLAACSADKTPAPSPSAAGDTPAGTEPAKQEPKKEVMKIALSVNPPSLDTHFTTATVTRQVGSHIYETLLTYDANYALVPMLAKEFKVSEDGLTTTIVLRSGIQFHNGKELKADDAIASINRWKGLSTVAKTTFNNVTAIHKKDDYTIEIVASQPSGVLLQALASPTQAASIMPQEIADAAGAQEVKEYVGTGPYQFVDWKQDQYVHLARFDGYQPRSEPASGFAGKKEALIKDLYFHFVTNAPSRIAGLQSGDYDFAEDIPIDNHDKLAQDPNLQMYIGKPSKMNLLFFNKKEGVFADLKMRQAVSAALDLDSIMLASAAKPEFYRIDPGLMFQEQKDWYSNAGADKINLKNAGEAKKRLAEAGYTNQPITILTSKEYDYLYKASLVIEQQLKGVGMNVKLEVYDWPTLLQKRKEAKAWDIFFTYANIYAHPTQITFVDSRKEYPGWYKNEQVDKLLDELAVSTDQKKSKELFHQVQQLYNDDVPTIKLGDMHALSAGRKNVKNFDYFYDVHFWNVSLE